MEKVKFDPFNFIWIGFHQPWIDIQGFNPDDILRPFVDKCLEKSLDVVSVTSMTAEPRCEGVNDRFGVLKEQARRLPKKYRTDTLGDNVLIVGREVDGVERKVYILDSQCAVVHEPVRGEWRRSLPKELVDKEWVQLYCLLLGTNKVENLRSFSDSVKQAREQGAIVIPRYQYRPEGFGKDKLDGVLAPHLENGDIDALIHDAQYRVPSVFRHVPRIGPLAAARVVADEYGKYRNEETREYARENDIPLIAGSDAHVLDSVGCARTEFYTMPNTGSYDDFIVGIRDRIHFGEFVAVRSYEHLGSFYRQVRQFEAGRKIELGADTREELARRIIERERGN